MGEDGHGVGADLVRDVPVGGDAVGSHHHRVHLSPRHEVAGHAVGDERGGDPVLGQLPRRQPRALQVGTGLVGEDVHHLALPRRGADHPEGGAVTCRRQRPRVAVGQEPGPRWDQLRSDVAHAPARGEVLGLHRQRLVEQRLPDGGAAASLLGLEPAAHPRDGPEQVDGGRARGRELLADAVELGAQRGPFPRRVAHAQGDAEGRGHADGGRSPDGHVLDRGRHLRVAPAADHHLLGGQPPLVDEHHFAVLPLHGGDHSRIVMQFGGVRACESTPPRAFALPPKSLTRVQTERSEVPRARLRSAEARSNRFARTCYLLHLLVPCVYR